MEQDFYREYFHIILIVLTIPVYWVVNRLLKKLKINSTKWRALLSFLITMFIIIVIGFLIVLRGFIRYHNIPGA